MSLVSEENAAEPAGLPFPVAGGRGIAPDEVRASDVDRKQVAEWLHAAHAEGQITLAEFDQRVGAAWQAKTKGELARLVFDLTAPRPAAPVTAQPAAPVVRRTPAALRVLTIIWLCIVVLNLVIWGLVTVTEGEWMYPWWVWVAGPSGAVLGTLYLTLGNREVRPKPDEK
jgi:hypothetical protein